MINLRRTLIVNKRFQYSFILKNILLLLFTFILILIAVKVWEYYEVSQGFLHRMPPNSEIVAWAKANNVPLDSAQFFREFIVRSKVYTFYQLLWKPLVFVLALNIIILVVAAIYYSNRIAGPIYRLTEMLNRKARGEEIQPVHFRKGDPFQELADALNKTLQNEKQNK